MNNKPNSNAVKALKEGKRLSYPGFSDSEFIYYKEGIVYDENHIELGSLKQFQESESSFNWIVKE